MGKLFADSGSAALCAFVPPYKKDREMARRLHQEARLPFLEVFVDTSFDECKKRDTQELLVAREVVEEVRVEAEKKPGLGRWVRWICSGCMS